jgi:hypothetical protein
MALPSISLFDLPGSQGATCGAWNLWRCERSNIYHYLVCVLNGAVVYWTSESNGWLNYLTGEGNWYVIWRDGTSDPQPRHELEVHRFINRKPCYELAKGAYDLQDWTVTVDDASVTLRYNPDVTVFVFDRRSASWTHDDQPVTLV